MFKKILFYWLISSSFITLSFFWYQQYSYSYFWETASIITTDISFCSQLKDNINSLKNHREVYNNIVWINEQGESYELLDIEVKETTCNFIIKKENIEILELTEYQLSYISDLLN